VNCYHDFHPFIPGISERTYTDEELEEMNRRENIPVEYNGKQYTRYEALQRQRRLETAIRAKRQEVKLLQLGGAAEEDILYAKCRYQGICQEYSMFSKAMGIPMQKERIGVGNAGDKLKKTVDIRADSGIIKDKETTNAVGHPVKIVDHIDLHGEPNSITQKVNEKGGIDRNYYDENGDQFKQISNNDHGHKAESKLGKHGEHAHDYSYDENGNLKHGKARDLFDEEREENSDIL